MSKKIVITGASGFLGSHLAERLRTDKRYTIIALSSRANEMKSNDQVINCYKDTFITDDELLRNAVVVNCAFPRNSTGTGMAEGLQYIQKLFERAVECKADAIINISSQSVYSATRMEAATEETPVSLETPYAVGKYATELMLESTCKKAKIQYSSIRLASLIGPGLEQRIVNRFVKQAIETGELTVKNNQQKFGYFDVEDAVNGIMKIIDKTDLTWQNVYNLGGKSAYTLIDIAETVKSIVEHETESRVQLTVIDGEERGSSEVNATLFSNEFGFESKVELAESVKKIYCNYNFSGRN